MKLTFKEKYLSIDYFHAVELPDFTVLTGINGAGKSHLLQAMQQRRVLIEGLENANIIYFNYETFKLESEGMFNAHGISSERENAWNFFNNEIKNIISAWKSNFLGENYIRLVDICKKEGKKLWSLSKEEIDDNSLYEQLKAYKGNIKNYFDNNQKGNQQAKNIFLLIKTLGYSIDEIQKDQFMILWNPYYLKDEFLPQQLGKIICDYHEKFRDNQVNRFENEKYGRSYPAISDKEFIEKYGNKPWEIINEILGEFNNLDYKINSPEGSNASASYQLKLINSAKNIEVGFENLSSGEKVLMALVASIYRSLSDNNFPEVLLLDEIDASLHPSMIRHFLKIIHDIFLKKEMKVILVTHSPTTVALAPEESIFVMNKEGDNRIEKKTKEEALSILTEGFVSLSQNESDLSISYSLSKVQLPAVLTEGITDKIILEIAWKKLFPEKAMSFYIQDCFDASFLRNLLKRAINNEHGGIFEKYFGRKFIALFDFDEEGYNCWNELSKGLETIEENPRKGLTKKHNIQPISFLLLPVINNTTIENQVIKNGNETYESESHFPIELMFYGIESLMDNFETELIPGGGKIIKFVGHKRKFAENCENLSRDDFKHFKILFESIQNILM